MKLVLRRELIGNTFTALSVWVGRHRFGINHERPPKRRDKQFHWSVGGKN